MSNKPQIVVVGADYHGEWAKDFYLAAKERGLESELVYTNTLLGGMGSSRMKAKVRQEVVKEFFRKYALPLFNLIKRARRSMSEYEVVRKIELFQKPGEKLLIVFIWTPPSVSLLERLKRDKNTTLVLWQGEPPVRNPEWNKAFPYFDHIFCVDEEWSPLFEDAVRGKMSFLPLSSNEKKFFPLSKEAKDDRFNSDIVFVGYYLPERAQMLAALKDRDLKIYGYWWENGLAEHPWIKDIYGGPVSNEDANKIFNGAKIAIGTLPGVASYSQTIITQRVFDISLAGNFQLSQYSPTIPKLFGDSIVMFRDRDELKRLVDFYLDHPAERKKLAAEAHAIALKSQSYKSRLRTILGTVGLDDHD